MADSIPFSRLPQWVSTAALLVLLGARGLAGQASQAASADALQRAGIAAADRGDYPSAIDDFKKALAIAPNQPAVRISLGQAYYQMGDLANARRQFESLHLDAPNDVQPAVRLAYVYIKLGRYADAVDLLAPFEPANQQNMDLEYAYAFALIQTGNAQDGVPLMEKVAQATHQVDAYVIAGSARMQMTEMDFALTDLQAAMQINPKLPGLVTMLGQTQSALGRDNDATASFQTALRSDPRDFDANIGLGDIRLKAHDYSAARPLLELALSLRPTVPLARLEMAKLNNATGRHAEAVTELESLVKAEPNYFEAHWELADVYFLLNRPQDGKRERIIAQQIMAQRQNDEPVALKPDN